MMYGSAPPATASLSPPRIRTSDLCAPAFLRSVLLVCGSVSVGLAISVGQPSVAMLSDPALAFLLRGMAVIKAVMVLGVVAVLFWRFGRPIRFRTAAVYVLGTAALAGASVLIWRLSSIPLAALVFHVAGFAVLVAAWRDGGVKLKWTGACGPSASP